jgi:DNA-binding beta-propeller fold protein YncE
VDSVAVELSPATSFGTNESLSGPRGLDVGPDGHVYVADTNNSRIVVYDETGALQSTIGVPTTNTNSTLGTLFQPWDVAVSDDGLIYVADTWNHRVSVFDSVGVPVATWGEYGVPEDGDNPQAMWGPRAITIDLDGNILVADTGGKRVRVYTPQGEWLRDIGSGGGAGLGQLDEPVGLAINPVNGELYVADTWNRRIQVFNTDGVAIRQFEVPMWYDNRSSPDRPYLAVSPDGTLIAISDMNAAGRNDGPRVVVYDLAGNPVLAFNAPEVDFAAGLHGIRLVAGLDFAPDGSLFVADTESSQVVKFAPLPAGGSLAPSPLEEVPLVTEESEDTETQEVEAEG